VLAFSYLPLLFAVAATRGAAPAPRPLAPRPAACSVVTRTDVRQALGRPVAKGRESADGPQSTCDYASGTGQVSVAVQRLTARLNVAAEIESLKAAIPGASVREAPDMGAHAFFLDIPGAGTQLYLIREGRDFVLISVLGFGDAAQVSGAAADMARKALGRL
jgi:hypothetical protein